MQRESGLAFFFLWIQFWSSTTALKQWKQVFSANYELTFYDEYAVSWEGARRFCQNIGADLVMLKESNVINAVKKTIGSAKKVRIFWLGASGENHDWTWVDNTKVNESLFTWLDGEPSPPQDRLIIIINNERVADTYGYYNEAGTICQRSRKSFAIRTGPYIFSFYLSKTSGSSYARSNSDARSLCSSVSSRLVIYTESSADIIKSKANANDTYWVDTGSGCTVLIGNQIVDKNCDDKYFPLCEQAQTHSITLSHTALEISKNSATEVNCTAYGYPTPTVSWKYVNGTDVSQTSNTTVYQSRMSGSSILYLMNVKVSDEGEFICYASNVIANTNYIETKRCLITVDGTPTIDRIVSSPCNSILQIYWRPHPRAFGLSHTIRVKNSASGNQVREIRITTDKNVQEVTEISGLQPRMTYNLQIAACKNQVICPYTVNATAQGMTIKNATMFADNDTCIVTWNWQYNISTIFRMNVSSSLVANISELNGFPNKTDNVRSYSFGMQPEQAYEVRIQPTGNTNFCPEPVKPVGICSGRESEQDFTEGNRNLITIIIPIIVGSVLVLLAIAFVVYKRKIRGNESVHKNNEPATSVANDTADYETVEDVEMVAAYSAIGDQPVVYVNYQQNSPYETVGTNEHNITDVYETPIIRK